MSDEEPRQEPRRPLVSYTVGPLSVSLGENEIGGSDRTWKSVTIRKTFNNKSPGHAGQWRHPN